MIARSVSKDLHVGPLHLSQSQPESLLTSKVGSRCYTGAMAVHEWLSLKNRKSASLVAAPRSGGLAGRDGGKHRPTRNRTVMGSQDGREESHKTHQTDPRPAVSGERYEARDGLEERGRGHMWQDPFPCPFVRLPVAPGMCSEVMADVLVFCVVIAAMLWMRRLLLARR
ncbi:unnamed protein product [Boreogadus saida]